MGEEETEEESISTLHLSALKLLVLRPAQRPHKAYGVILIPEWPPHHGTLCRACRWGHRWQVCCCVTARKHQGRQRNKCKACLDRMGGPRPCPPGCF